MPKNPQAASESTEGPKKSTPSAADSLIADILAINKKADPKPETKPEPKPAKKEETSAGDVVKSFGAGIFDTAIASTAIITRHQSVDDIVAGKKQNDGMVSSAVKNVWDMVSNPVRTATALKDEGAKAISVIDHGTAKERAHLAGSVFFTLGTAGFTSAKTVGKVSATTEALAGAEIAMTKTVAARSLVSEVRSAVTVTSKEALEEATAKSARRIPEGLTTRVAENTVKPGSQVALPNASLSETVKRIVSPVTTRVENLATKIEGLNATGVRRQFAGIELDMPGAQAFERKVTPKVDLPEGKVVGEPVKAPVKEPVRDVVPEPAAKVELKGPEKSFTEKPVSERPVSERPVSDKVVDPAGRSVAESPVGRQNFSPEGSQLNRSAPQVAQEAVPKVEALVKSIEQSGVKVSDDVARSLNTINEGLRKVAAEGPTPRILDDLADAVRKVEGGFGADASKVAPKLTDLGKMVDDVAVAGGRRPAAEVMQIVEREAASMRSQSTTLTRAIDDAVAASPNAAKTGELLSGNVRKLDQLLENPRLSSTAVKEIEQVVKQLDSPEFARFISENPKVAAAVAEIKNSAVNLSESALARPQSLTAKLPAPQVAAELGAAKVEGLSARLAENGVKVDGELAGSLRTVEQNLKTIAERGATPDLIDDMNRAMRSVEQKLGRDVLDSGSPAGKSLMEARQAVDNVTGSVVERNSLAQIERSVKVVDNEVGLMRNQTREFSRVLDDSAQAGKNGAVVDKLQTSLKKLDDALEQPATSSAGTVSPAARARQVEQLVKELDRPEFSRYFAENPKAAQLVEDLKVRASTMGNAASKIESSAMAIDRVGTVARFGDDAQRAVTRVDNIAASASPELKMGTVSNELKQISNELATIKQGANSEQVLASVRNRVEALEAQGAHTVAREVKDTVAQLERSSQSVSRIQKMEATVGTIEKEVANVGSKAEKLSANLLDDSARTNFAPGQKPVQSVQAQIADNLDLIARQSKLITNSVDDVAAVTRIKNSITKIDELGGANVLSGESKILFQDLKRSVANLDRAAVEVRGLKTFEASSTAIVRDADRIASIAGRVSDNAILKTDANAASMMRNVERSAAEARLASTFEQQSTAIKKLTQQVDDPALQASMRRSMEGAKMLDELKASTNSLKQNLEVRALEQVAVKLESQAPVAARAATAVEKAVAADASLAGNAPLKQAINDYVKAADNLAVRSERAATVKQLDQQMAIIEREAAGKIDLAALKSSHRAVVETASDVNLLARSVMEKRLPVVEDLFNQIGKANSSATQRELIRQTSAELQVMRFLESESGVRVGSKLELAQNKLVVAANELEVAAYRSNLIKMAAAGNNAAADKLLLAGLTSDGFKTMSLLPGPGPLGTFMDFLAVRRNLIPVIGGGGDAGRMMRTLSADDVIFANNRNAIFSPTSVRAASAASMVLGAGATYASDRMVDTTAPQDNLRAVSGDTRTVGGAELKSDAMTAVSAQAIPQTVPRAEAYSNSTAQTVMRNAYAADVRNRSTFNANSSAFTAGSGNEIGAFGLNINDPDYEQKKFFQSIYGTDYFRGKGAEPTPVEKAAFSVFAPQTLGLPGSRVRNENDRFEKPASDRFNFNSALLLNTPVSLMNSNAARRDASGRIVGLNNGNGNGMVAGSRLTSDTKQVISSLTASANEGGVGRGAVGADEEQTEGATLEQGGAITAQTTNNNHDDEDDDAVSTSDNGSNNDPNNDPANDPANTPIGVQPVITSQAVAATTASESDELSRTIMQGPPRKRQRTNQAV